MQDNRNASGADGANVRRRPLRTIDDLERRQQQVLERERDAVAAVAMLLRELTIRLPDQSPLIRRFAEQARAIDIQATGPYVASSMGRSLDVLVGNLVRHFEEG